jgi:hypothetical protein
VSELPGKSIFLLRPARWAGGLLIGKIAVFNRGKIAVLKGGKQEPDADGKTYFIDKSGSQVSEGATCAIPLYVQKGNRLAAIGGSGAGVDTFSLSPRTCPLTRARR